MITVCQKRNLGTSQCCYLKMADKSRKLRTSPLDKALPCLIASCGASYASNTFLVLEKRIEGMDQESFSSDDNPPYRVRKLTPEECFTFMGLSAEDVEKCRALGVSDSELYKQAGNGIVPDCVGLLAEHLYKSQYDKEFVCTDERRAAGEK